MKEKKDTLWNRWRLILSLFISIVCVVVFGAQLVQTRSQVLNEVTGYADTSGHFIQYIGIDDLRMTHYQYVLDTVNKRTKATHLLVSNNMEQVMLYSTNPDFAGMPIAQGLLRSLLHNKVTLSDQVQTYWREGYLICARNIQEANLVYVVYMSTKDIGTRVLEKNLPMIVISVLIVALAVFGNIISARMQKMNKLEIEGKEQERKRYEYKSRLSYMMNVISEAYVRTNSQYDIIEINDAMTSLVGFSREELYRMNLLSLLDPASAERLAELGPTQKTFREECIIQCKNEIQIFTLVNKSRSQNSEATEAEYHFMISDISKLKYAYKELREINERLDMILTATNLAFWDLDLRSRAFIYNEYWTNMLGYETNDIEQTYQSIEVLVHPNDVRRVLEVFRNHESGDSGTFKCELRMKMKEGRFKWVQALGRIIERDDDNRGIRIVGIFVDIDHTKQIMRQLKKAKERAEDANLAKSHFIANLSHEIRTPMNAIIGFIYLLEQTTLTEDQKKYLKKIDYATSSLLEMIDEILDFSKIEADRLELENVSFDLRYILDNVTGLFEGKTQGKGLGFNLEIDPRLPNYLSGDPLRLNQILVNLVNNAIKFTEQGSIKVVAKCMDILEDSVLLSISVTDTGIGIDQKRQRELFKPFVQADGSTTRKFGGTGLGLSISKKLIELMGGTISLESKPDLGSTFFIQVWMKIGEKRLINEKEVQEMDRLALSDETMKASNFNQGKILIVEDNVLNQEILSEILKQRNEQIIIADNGEVALEIVSTCDRNHFSMILMDVQMPIMDGYEATKQIRKQKGYKNIPIIAVTANADVETQKK